VPQAVGGSSVKAQWLVTQNRKKAQSVIVWFELQQHLSMKAQKENTMISEDEKFDISTASALTEK
jgi:hypothetical protein